MDPSELFLQQFGLRLAQVLAPTAPTVVVEAAIRRVLYETRAQADREVAQPARGMTGPARQQWELVYCHDCEPTLRVRRFYMRRFCLFCGHCRRL